MKLYSFYHYDKNMTAKEYRRLREEGCTDYDIRKLYAVTSKKRLAKEFKKQRDMNQFIEIVTDDLDEEEAHDFMRRHRGAVLEYRTYMHYIEREIYEQHSIPFKILSTEQEKNLVDVTVEVGMFNERLFFPDANPFILKKEYRVALINLGYVAAYRYMNSDKKIHYYDPEEPDFDLPMFDVDEFEAFITLFKESFRC